MSGGCDVTTERREGEVGALFQEVPSRYIWGPSVFSLRWLGNYPTLYLTDAPLFPNWTLYIYRWMDRHTSQSSVQKKSILYFLIEPLVGKRNYIEAWRFFLSVSLICVLKCVLKVLCNLSIRTMNLCNPLSQAKPQLFGLRNDYSASSDWRMTKSR